MNVATVRNELAAGVKAADAGIHPYPRPPGQVGAFPALIVRDPTLIRYHRTAGQSKRITLPVFVIVSRAAAQDGTEQLDTLVSPTGVPAVLEAITGASWEQLVVDELAGGYFDFVQGNQTVGLGAVLETSLTFN